MQKPIVALAVVAALGGASGRAFAADEPQAQFQLERGSDPHAGLPFTLTIGVVGFDETPPPVHPKLEIPGAKVSPAGAQPNVSRSIQIINGRRTDSTQVTWALHWRVEVAKAGRIHIPTTTVTQGSKKATAQGADLDVDAVPVSDDMKLELQLPPRPVFVGETIEAHLVWMFRRQPENQTFDVPLAAMNDVTVSAPPITDKRRVIELQLGGKTLQLPYDVDNAESGGQKWARVTLKLFVAPRAAGKLEVPPASVVAGFAVGRPDFFGNVSTKLYRTNDTTHSLEVKPLPETDKPPSFTGAVGSQFSIAAATSRSVVQLGEPVELTITVKSDQRLDTLSLGKLDYEGGLPKDKFTVPADPPTGELSDDGKTKTFKITATVTAPTTEIPAIAFAYFDPVKSRYQTIHSDPIALSVKAGGAVVGTSDVVGATPSKPGPVRTPEALSGSDIALVGADLALSSAGDVTGRPLGGTLLWLLIGLLYAIPLGIFALCSWLGRTRDVREEAAGVRAARNEVERLLARAEHEPARDTAGPLASALRSLARALDRDLDHRGDTGIHSVAKAAGTTIDDSGVLARLETESFSPSASSAPLSPELRTRAGELVARWTAAARRPKAVRSTGIAVILVAFLGASRSHAAAPDPVAAPAAPSGATTSLDDARRSYERAMAITQASARKAAFLRAEAALADAVRSNPDRPELLADWGNAALAAGDVGNATLAYRRSLAIDSGNARARRNLAWLRSRQPDVLRPGTSGAADALLFFNDWPRGRRLLGGAVAFAIVVLLLAPWGSWTYRRRRGLRVIALVPAAVWVALTASALLEDRRPDDAVVMDATVLRAADSAGAPAALAQTLPTGTEVMVLERRDAWTRVRIANGTAGWVPSGTVQRIAQ